MAILGERFYQTSNAVFCYGLTPHQFTVYSYLRCCAGQRGHCWPSMKTIALNCSCSKNTARAAVQALTERGFIRTVATYTDLDNAHRRQTNNTYFILDLPPLPTPKKRKPLYKKTDGSLTDNMEEVGA